MDLEEIIRREWIMFQAVHGEGGRAPCQEDWHTFYIMREAQFSQWPEQVAESYLNDLKEAERSGRNMVMEKYAWMMEHTNPNQFRQIVPFLMVPGEEAKRQIDHIVSIQVTWMRQFAQQYPHVARRGRPISAGQDDEFAVSGETYLKGELYTYSDQTLLLYQSFVDQLYAEGKNLHTMVTEKMVRLKGYQGLEAAEAALCAPPGLL